MKKNNEIWELMESEGLTYGQARHKLRKIKLGITTTGKTWPKLTKQDLINMGITDVSEDGRVWVNNVEVAQVNGGPNYEYKIIYKAYLNPHKDMYVHRIVYAWFYGEIPENFVVDHIDEDKTNNVLENLQLLTLGENIKKSRCLNQRITRNQYTKGMSDEEILENRRKKAQEKEENTEALRKARKENYELKEAHSKEVQERARKIRDLKYAIDLAHMNYKESGSNTDRAVWKECIQELKDFIEQNPKISWKNKNSNEK